jgi:hypothetical protein
MIAPLPFAEITFWQVFQNKHCEFMMNHSCLKTKVNSKLNFRRLKSKFSLLCRYQIMNGFQRNFCTTFTFYGIIKRIVEIDNQKYHIRNQESDQNCKEK